MTARSSWMLSLADMLSILLCFLVLAYGLEAVPAGQREGALASIRKVFRPGEAVAAAASPALTPETHSGNYWATWLKTRIDDMPALAHGGVVAEGASARLSLDGAALTDATVADLADLLRRSGAAVAVRGGAASAAPVAWADAGAQAQQLADRLAAAGLPQPRVVVREGLPALAVEIGGTEQ